MAHARWHFVMLTPRLAQVAVLGKKWQIINSHAIPCLIFIFPNHYAAGARCIIMLLLASDLTSMAAGAIVIIDQNSVPSHGSLLMG